MCATLVAVSGAKKVLIGVVAAPLVVIALVASAWGVDAAVNQDQVARNVDLAGTPVGGLSRSQLRTKVADLGTRFPATPVEIRAGDLTLTTTAGALGLSVDQQVTLDDVWNQGRSDPLPRRPVRWLASVFSARAAGVSLNID